MAVILTIDEVEQQLSKFEQGLCMNGHSTSWIWMSVEIRWHPKSRKNGGTLKRGSSYGTIRYFDMLRQKRDSFDGLELTRDEAIQEILKPYPLRIGLADIEKAKECYVCGKIGIGEDKMQSKWGKFSYQPNDKLYRAHLDLCESCTSFIVSRHLENMIR